jgi:hypothetical protein
MMWPPPGTPWCARGVDQAAEADRQLPLPELVGRIGEGDERHQDGGVHQGVEPAPALHDLRHRRAKRRKLADIERQGQQLAPVLGHRGSGPAELAGVDVRQADAGPGAAQRARNPVAESAPGARHQGGLAHQRAPRFSHPAPPSAASGTAVRDHRAVL